MRAVVLALCAGRWLSAAEMALLLDRDAGKLQSRFLAGMVREGLLELRYPEVRNRPDQAYRSSRPAGVT
jgi:ATP-dependent DNA helicase RecG